MEHILWEYFWLLRAIRTQSMWIKRDSFCPCTIETSPGNLWLTCVVSQCLVAWKLPAMNFIAVEICASFFPHLQNVFGRDLKRFPFSYRWVAAYPMLLSFMLINMFSCTLSMFISSLSLLEKNKNLDLLKTRAPTARSTWRQAHLASTRKSTVRCFLWTAPSVRSDSRARRWRITSLTIVSKCHVRVRTRVARSIWRALQSKHTARVRKQQKEKNMDIGDRERERREERGCREAQ